MEKSRIFQKAAKEIERRVSAVSNLQKDIYGMKSDILDILLIEENTKHRKTYGEIIKQELNKKIEIAKKRTPPRKKYIENMQRIIKDLDKRIAGKKTDDDRKKLLNLNKRSFTNEIIKEIVDTTIQHAATNTIEQDLVYENIGKKMEYKQDLARLLEQRSDGITDDKQKKKIDELIENIKNMKESEKKIPGKRTKMQNIITSIRLLTALGFIGRGGIEFTKEMRKEPQSQGQKMHINKENLPKEYSISLEKLQSVLNDTLLGKGITYEDIVNAVNATINKESKKTIIDFLYASKILELQKYLCMNENSPYQLNKATGIIDENTMNILKGGRFGMTGKEILEHDSITQDVKDAYRDFMQGIMNNNNENYLIESKICMHSFLFDRNHRLIDYQPIIVGRDLGKDQEYVPFERFYENGVRKYYKDTNPKELNRNTPEGLFAIEGIDKIEEKDYEIDGPKEAIILDPILLTTPGLIYDKKRIKMWDHPIFIAEGPGYLQALETPEITDNNKSKGCINRKNFGRVKENLKTEPNGSRIYITQYTKYKNMEQQKNQICMNNQKKYFPKKGKYK